MYVDKLEFEKSKTYLKRVVKLLHSLNSPLEDLKLEEDKLKTGEAV